MITDLLWSPGTRDVSESFGPVARVGIVVECKDLSAHDRLL